MKKIILLSLGLLGSLSYSQTVFGYTVKIKNNTKFGADFYVHSSMAGCCYGTGAEGSCKVTIAAGQTGEYKHQYKFGNTCSSIVCIKAIAAHIRAETGVKRFIAGVDLSIIPVEVIFNLESDAFKKYAALPAAGLVTGAGVGASTFTPEGVAAGAVIGAVGGAVAAGAQAISYQCTNMEVTLEQKGAGLEAKDYAFTYKKQ